MTKLWGEKNFQNALKCRWTVLRKDRFSSASINARIDAGVKLLADARVRPNDKCKVIGAQLLKSAEVYAIKSLITRAGSTPVRR